MLLLPGLASTEGSKKKKRKKDAALEAAAAAEASLQGEGQRSGSAKWQARSDGAAHVGALQTGSQPKGSSKQQKAAGGRGADGAQRTTATPSSDLHATAAVAKTKSRKGDAILVPSSKVAGVTSSRAASTALATDFMPANRFEGARPGFAFKVGFRGLGYYVDMLQQKLLQKKQQQAVLPVKSSHDGDSSKPNGKATVASKPSAVPSKQGKQSAKQRALLSNANKPIIAPPKASAWSDSDSDGDAEEDSDGPGPQRSRQTTSHQINGSGGRVRSSRPGAQAPSGGSLHSDGSDSDFDEDAADHKGLAQRAGKAKALPGRLRKKLAKERAGSVQRKGPQK